VVKISPEWVMGREQGKCSGTVATFSFWTGMFRDGIIIIIFIYCNWVVTRWQWLFYL